MCNVSSPLLRISSLKSLRVPTLSTLISSTVPFAFISVWRSYLSTPLAAVFCASPAATKTSADTIIPRHCMRLLGCRIRNLGCRMRRFRLSDMAPPRCLTGTRHRGRVPVYVQHGPRVMTNSGSASQLRYDKAVNSIGFKKHEHPTPSKPLLPESKFPPPFLRGSPFVNLRALRGEGLRCLSVNPDLGNQSLLAYNAGTPPFRGEPNSERTS